MSARLIDEVWQYPGLLPKELLIMLCIADGCTDDGRFGWFCLDVHSLCRRSRMPEDEVKSLILSLTEKGLVGRDADGWIRIGGVHVH